MPFHVHGATYAELIYGRKVKKAGVENMCLYTHANLSYTINVEISLLKYFMGHATMKTRKIFATVNIFTTVNQEIFVVKVFL